MRLLGGLIHDNRGLATVEAAIGLPVILLTMFATMEGGLMVMTRHEMDRAAREAGRYCSLYSVNPSGSGNNQCTQANVTAIVNQTLTTPTLANKVISAPTCTTVAGVPSVSITISGVFHPFTALFSRVDIPLSITTAVVPDWNQGCADT